LGGASIEVCYEVRDTSGAELYARATTTVVLVDPVDGRPRRTAPEERAVWQEDRGPAPQVRSRRCAARPPATGEALNEQVPLFAVVVTTVSMLASAVVVAVVMRRAATGRLGVNHLAGLRTRSTMRDEAAWRAAHRAARPPTDVGMAGMG